MRTYELTVILDPTLDDNTSKAEIDKIEKLITNSSGKILKIDKWGIRRLSYLIKKHNQGNYFLFLIEAESGTTSAVEKSLRINDNVLRYLTVVVPRDIADKAVAKDEPEPVTEETGEAGE
jgi:small subunit ribosomal protein S6